MVIDMHLKNIIANFLYDKDAYILWFDNKVYLYGIKLIELLNDRKIIIRMNNSKLKIDGSDLKLQKVSNNEVLIYGDINAIKK